MQKRERLVPCKGMSGIGAWKKLGLRRGLTVRHTAHTMQIWAGHMKAEVRGLYRKGQVMIGPVKPVKNFAFLP
jgi:hypothetical protein